MKNLLQSLKIYLFLTLVLGLVYPLCITLIAQILFPFQANGSLINIKGQIIGSTLIGQSFVDPKYFHSRPSAIDYDSAVSGASNLAPSSAKLLEITKQKIDRVRMENSLGKRSLPADMLLSSASGIDPHISIENALIQAKRIAKIRKLSWDKVNNLIADNTDKKFTEFWGRWAVNVLKLNIALDKVQK